MEGHLLVLIVEAPQEWLPSPQVAGLTYFVVPESTRKALHQLAEKGEFTRYSHVQICTAVQFSSDIARTLHEAQQRTPHLLLVGHRSTVLRGWAWVYHLAARFWWAVLGIHPLQDPTSPYRSYPTTLFQNCLAWKEEGLALEQKILLEAEAEGFSLDEVRLGNVATAQRIAVSLKGIWSLVVLYAKSLVRRVKSEFSYPALKGESFFVHLHHMVQHEIRAHLAPHKASLAVSVGVFWGMTPFHGFHVILGFMTALLAKLNRPLTFLGLNITCPPLLLFWIPFSTKVGEWILPGELGAVWHMALANGGYRALVEVGFEGLKYYIVGSLILAPILAVLAYPCTYLFFYLLEKRGAVKR